MNVDSERLALLKLSIRCGLLGNVTANLASLYGRTEGKRVIMSAFFFNAPTERDRECIEDAAAQIVGDFPEDFTLETLGRIADVKVNSISWGFLRAEAT